MQIIVWDMPAIKNLSWNREALISYMLKKGSTLQNSRPKIACFTIHRLFWILDMINAEPTLIHVENTLRMMTLEIGSGVSLLW